MTTSDDAIDAATAEHATPRRVAVLLGPDFEDAEFTVPYNTLVEHGHRVDVIGSDEGTELRGKRGEASYTTDMAIDDTAIDDYDLVLVPGGFSPDRLRTDDRIVSFVAAASARGLPIAAICHAGSLLIEADVVDGVTMTSWPSIRTDLRNAGAEWVDQEVVEDHGIISSRNPDDLPAFVGAVLSRLGDGIER